MPRTVFLMLVLYAALPVLAADDDSAPAQNDPDALVAQAQRYEHGEGVERDVDAAIQLYCRAARAGSARAQYQLGWLYANGRGVARDDALAGAWFRLAAEQGDAYAERMLRYTPADASVKPRCVLGDGSIAAPDQSGRTAASRREVTRWVERLAPQYGLDPSLVLAVIRAESGFNPRALSPKNAQGLMQLIPETAQRFGVRDVWDPVDNIRGGMAYLRWLLDHFEGDVTLALAGYNAGENAVARHRGVPPYAETRAYVRKILRLVNPVVAVASD